jgi:3-methyladenine DNA glycosylase Tag
MPGGFAAFVWRLAPVNDRERLVRDELMPSHHMRSEFTSGMDRLDADGVHPTASIARASKALKAEGFKFLGETTTLSWFQAAGLVNHHKSSCPRFGPCNEEFASVHAALTAPAAAPAPEPAASAPASDAAARSDKAKRKRK